MKKITFTSVLSWPELTPIYFWVAKMISFSSSLHLGSEQKSSFRPPQADMNLVVPQRNGRKRSIL